MNFVRATKEDSSAIKEFLKKNDPEDYILDVIDGWFEKRTIFLAVKDEIVGMNYVKYSPDGEAWLGGMRVDKDHRREGIATQLTEKCIEEANAKKARLFTSEDNTAACSQVKRMGFKKKAWYTLMYTEIDDECGRKKFHDIEKGEVWSNLQESTILKQNNYLLPRSFTFYTASPELVNKGYVVEEGYAVVEEVEWEEEYFQIVYFEGEKIIDALQSLASQRGHTKLWALVPRNETLISVLTARGFEYEDWAERGVVFEKKI